jgi:hypothetical protein
MHEGRHTPLDTVLGGRFFFAKGFPTRPTQPERLITIGQLPDWKVTATFD